MKSTASNSFPASYDNSTKLISGGILVVILFVAFATHSIVVGILAALLPLASYAWSPRRYTVSGGAIIVRRLAGDVRIPLDGIREARIATADDFRGCIRTFGNGGLFGYYGQFRS